MKALLRIGISLGLLAWLLSRTDPRGIIDAIVNLSPLTWAVAFLMYLVSQVVSSLRWYFLAHALGFGGSWLMYLKYYFVGMYFNLFLPTSVGGDVLKVIFLSRGTSNKLRATYSILSDRLFGLAAMFILGAGAAFLTPNVLPPYYRSILYMAGGSSIVLLLFLPAVHKAISKLMPAIGQRISIILTFWRQPKALLAGIGLSLILQSLGMGAVSLLAIDMGLPLPPAFYFAAFPLVAIVTLLPISFNGIGVREGGFIYFLGLKGVASSQALTLSLCFFAVQVSASLIGGLAYAAGFHKQVVTSTQDDGR